MQKKILSLTVVACILGAFAFLFTIAYQRLHHPEPTPAPQTHLVLAVDLNNNKILNQDEITSAKDAILAVRKPGSANTSNDIFNSITALEQLDANHDNRLDKKDPIFPYLELVFFTGKEHKYVPLTKAGITAIIFDKAILAQITNGSNPIGKEIGHAVKKNGEKLSIQIIAIKY